MEKIKEVNDTLLKLFNEVTGLEQRVVITGEFKNISNNDMHIIEAIGIDEPKTMSTVAKNMRVTVGTLTIAINSLVKKGYVERSRSEEDRRVVLVSLTELGERAYHHHAKYHHDMIQATVTGLTHEEVTILIKALSNLSIYFNDVYNKPKE